MRKRPNVLITGTPGTGKTTLAKKLALNISADYIDIASVVKEGGFYTEYDAELDTNVLDEDKLLDFLEERLNSEEGGVVLDYHSSDFFPKRWFDFVFVLRCETQPLFDRLTERGYSERKRRENIECEIFGTVAEEARESYEEDIVIELSNNTPEEMERNVARMTQIVGEYSGRGRREDK